MSLDVYVGPLTRYYAGDWETIVQQVAKQSGIPVKIMRPPQPDAGWLEKLLERFRPRGLAPAAKAVHRWRDRLRRELGLPELDWNEAPEAEYATDKPAWDCYGALVLWAAYNELPKAKRRETAEKWEEDSAYATSRINTQSRYRHLFADTEIWLPVDFTNPLRTAAIGGCDVVVGSSIRLLAELRDLNARTWNVEDKQILDWRSDCPPPGAPLETSARFGFSIFYELTKRSVAAHLPMKLDY